MEVYIYDPGPQFPGPEPLSFHRVPMSEHDSDIPVRGYTPLGLIESILGVWRERFISAQVNTNSIEFRSWIEFFIEHNLGLGTVDAWLGALVRCPLRFLGPGNNPVYGLKPEYFDSNCDLIERYRLGSEPGVDKKGDILMTDGMCFARRIWDVYANRVIPRAWVPDVQLTPISHAWVALEEMQYIWTSVNNYSWPVPIPKDISLNDVRQELISRGIEYTWLDVLCLRQEIDSERAAEISLPAGMVTDRETKRAKEWETDVPLIGGIYLGEPKVVTYFHGLGRVHDPQRTIPPFDLNERDWFNRAWTLQEAAPHHKIIPGGGPNRIDAITMGRFSDISRSQVDKKVKNLICEMGRRSASKPLDRVAGLFFPLWQKETIPWGHQIRIPIYKESMYPEQAWSRLVHAFASAGSFTIRSFAWELLADFPIPSAEHWFPTLSQAMWNGSPHAHAQSGNHQANLRRPDEVPPPFDYSLQLRDGTVFPRCECEIKRGSFKFIVVEDDIDAKYCFKPPSRARMPSPEVIQLRHGEEYVIFSFFRVDEGVVGKRNGSHFYPTEELVIVCKNVTRWRPHYDKRAFFRKIVSWVHYKEESVYADSGSELATDLRGGGKQFDMCIGSWTLHLE